MMGTATPRPRTLRTISGTAAAASSVLTVTRTSWDPAWASRATWIAVASASAVSVLVIDWTTTGWAEPTRTPPTSTETVGRRAGRSRSGDVTGQLPTWRATSNTVIQMRNVNRATNPTAYVSCSARSEIRFPYTGMALSRMTRIRPPSSGGNGSTLTSARFADSSAARYRTYSGPRFHRMSPRSNAIPTGPEAGGAVVGLVTIDWPRSARP